MRYRKLGRTGIDVSVQCLGTMMFGNDGNADRDDCARIIHAAIDSGINFIDTADTYGEGETERIVGAALKGRRDKVVLATKGHFQMGEGKNRSGNSRLWLIRAVDESLRRLETDWIDLYQVHRPDPSVDIEETLSVLTDLVRAGKIRAFGSSYTPPEVMIDAWHVAERRGYARFRTEQPSYSVMTRGVEASVLPTCQQLGLGVLVSSPLAWGFLSGRYRRGRTVDLGEGRARLLPDRFNPELQENARKFETVEALAEIADELGRSLPQLAIAFVVSHLAVTSAIIGPRTMTQLQDLSGADFHLTDDVLDRIDAVIPPGTNLYEPSLAKPRALTEPHLRRRRPDDRYAA